ncbi:hypothetical protein AB0E96_29040 [Kitasatospora sp. NPDC036755]|uniref:hypothetical protein n=1 Tax=Kitasatospora sp. NPDC036755 TaxID=3154600 RepID=UPI0033C20BFC
MMRKGVAALAVGIAAGTALLGGTSATAATGVGVGVGVGALNEPNQSVVRFNEPNQSVAGQFNEPNQ